MSKKINLLALMSIICLFTLFSSCILTLRLNNEKKYKLTCDEKQIEFEGKRIRGSLYNISITSKKGEFDFFSDSLCIIAPHGYDIYHNTFTYEKNEILGHQLIKKGKTLTYYFICSPSYGTYIPIDEFKILIPPSGFIKCDGKDLVTDTISIKWN